MLATTSFEAASLNNSGAYMLLNNQYAEAISMFRSSVLLTKQQLLFLEAEQVPLTPGKGGLHMNFIDLDCSSSQSHNDSPSGSLDTEDAFVCKSVIIITQDDSKDLSLLPLVAASAVYNLAIAHHLYGQRNQSTRYLQKALQYYELSYKMQHTETNPLHTLAVLNNVAMIHRSLENQLKAKKFLQQLYAVMSLLELSGQKQNKRRWTGFWSNVLCLVLDPPASAAAA